MSDDGFRIADQITMNTHTGAITIDDTSLPFFTHPDGPTIELIDGGMAYVGITFLTESVHILGRNSPPIRVINSREPLELPPAECTCSEVPDRRLCSPVIYDAAGCPIHDPIAYIRDIGAREKAAALAWLTEHVDAIYEDLGLTRENTV